MQFDLSLEELRGYRPDIRRPSDFDEFWAVELAEARALSTEPEFELIDSIVTMADIYDVSFSGYGGSAIKGWLLVPKILEPRTPVVVEFIGYTGGRGRPYDRLEWVGAGYPHLIMDSRGQGWIRTGSDTPDAGGGGEPSAYGFMMRGIESPTTYYFTRLFVDAALALDLPDAHPATAGRGIIATGGSQGGGLALAATSLNPRVSATAADVPFLAHFHRAVEITDRQPYEEIAGYLRLYPDRIDNVFETLSYIDVANHAERIRTPVLFSVGLNDAITPPSTVFAAYNRVPGPKHIEVYPYNGHDGGGSLHFERKVKWLRSGEFGMAP